MRVFLVSSMCILCSMRQFLVDFIDPSAVLAREAVWAWIIWCLNCNTFHANREHGMVCFTPACTVCYYLFCHDFGVSD